MKHDNRQSNHSVFQMYMIINCVTLILMYSIVQPAWGNRKPDRIIKAGDGVELHVICREPSGEIIMTTIATVADDPARKKSRAFIPQEKYDPLLIVAGQAQQYAGAHPLKLFRNELVARLSDQVVGMRAGESVSVKLTAPVPKNLPKEERYLTLSRTTDIEKEMVTSKTSVADRLGRPPQLGDTMPAQYGLQWKVSKISDDTVTLSTVCINGNQTETIWGRGILHEQPGKYLKLEIHPELGRLVRVGPFLGYVSAVDDVQYTVDYGYPFGRETLDCDITIVSIKDRKPNTNLF